MKITVDCTQDIGPLDHFWESTGFSPASLLLNADMRQAMAYIGSVAHGGITYVRPHYLLELVTADGLGTESPQYDWSVLDKAMDVLVKNDLRPIFELMGNPSGYFTDYTDDTQVHAWRRLVRDLARHSVDRYGLDTVRGWYFETWNEPDAGWWTQSEVAFCNYYDACSEGLKDVDEGIRLGGPGSCRHLSSLLKTFLAHCDDGVNYFTGEKGTRLDFISVHEKGVRSCVEDLNPDSESISDREIAIIRYIREHHPRLADVPFMNNECDPQTGWGHIHTWRGRPYYAAIAAKIINQHLVKIIDDLGCNYVILSNDNAFLGQWGNRSLLARFGAIEDVPGQSRHRTQPSDLQEDVSRRQFEMLKKPILNVMTMLSLLGDQRCAITGVGDAGKDIGAIATRRGDAQVAVLVYHSRDQIMSSGEEHIELQLEGLPFDCARLTHYRIDAAHGDPFAVWEAMGAPRYPSPEQYAEMRKHQELAMLDAPQDVTIAGQVERTEKKVHPTGVQEVRVRDGALILSFDLPLPSVSLVLLSAKPGEAPWRVEGVRAERYEGLLDMDEVMVIWQANHVGHDVRSRVLRTYEVLYADSPDGPFKRVNEVDVIDTAFLHIREKAAGAPRGGFYKIRAVDYWGRRGEASEVIAL